MYKNQLFSLILAVCPAPILINQTKEPIPQSVIDGATKTCKREYNKCLKKLIKRPGHQNYWAICG